MEKRTREKYYAFRPGAADRYVDPIETVNELGFAERRQHERLVAREMARAEARRLPSPQLDLGGE